MIVMCGCDDMSLQSFYLQLWRSNVIKSIRLALCVHPLASCESRMPTLSYLYVCNNNMIIHSRYNHTKSMQREKKSCRYIHNSWTVSSVLFGGRTKLMECMKLSSLPIKCNDLFHLEHYILQSFLQHSHAINNIHNT